MPGHGYTDIPFAVFGGKNTRHPGRQVPEGDGRTAASVANGTTTGNRPTNDVWLALAPIFGVELDGLARRRSSPGRCPAWSPERNPTARMG